MIRMIQIIFILAATVLALPFSGSANAATDWAKVEQLLGRQAVVQGDVHRFGFPRSDLKVTLDGVEVKPALALGSWLAFLETKDGAMIMGDLVLTDSEVNPVMKRLIEGGVQITALHNHLLRSTPATMYMHVEGHGDPIALAKTLRAGLSLSKTPLTASYGGASPQIIDLDTTAIEKTLGHKGKANGGVYQFSIPRAETIRDSGMTIPSSMGGGTVINFQPTGNGKAAITGDFVLTAKEVNPVMQALRANGIDVTALHGHMLNDEPRLFFMHFWANDDAQKLAQGLKAALDKTNIAKP